MQRLLFRDGRCAQGVEHEQCNAQHHRHHHQHVAQHCGHLRSHQMGDLVHKRLDGVAGAQFFELGRHGRGGHGWLLGGHREMQQLHQHKAHRIVHTRPETRPEGRQRQGVQAKLDQRGESNHQPAARCLVDHGAVFGWRAGDVVLARFSAALGHLGRDQRGVGGEQCAQTAPLLAHLHQRRHQPGGRQGGLGRQQAVEQQPHAHDAFAQLAQAEHQPDGDAVVFKVRVNRGRGGAAGLQPLAQALRGFVEPVGGAQGVQHLHAQALHVADQRMEGLGFARFFAHAKAQFRGKPGREDLSRAVGDGVEQRVAPQRDAAFLARRHQQGGQAVELCFVQRGHPLRVKFMGHCQHEQFRRIDRVRRARQPLGAQARRQLAHKSGAWRKAEVGQQGGDIYRVHQLRPPSLQARAQLWPGFDRIQKKLQSGRGAGHGVAVAAHPFQQMDEPEVAVGKVGLGVQFRQQARQVGGAAQCSTLPFRGSPVGPW